MAIKHIETIEEFNNETKDKKVILDFWAPWCGPCRSLGPTFEKVSDDYDDVSFLKVNVDDAQNIASKFNIMSIPTLVFLNNGENVDQQMGAISKEQLKAFIDKNK